MKKMEENIISMNNEICLDNNNLLQEIKIELQKITDFCKDNDVLKIINDLQIKIINIIRQNSVKTELIKKNLNQLCNQMINE